MNFRKITEDSFDDIIKMKRPGGENFAASNAHSLAQAWLYRDNGDAFPFAAYSDDTVAGFMLFEEDMDEERLDLWRIMPSTENEGKGYGTAAVQLIIQCAKDSDAKRASVSIVVRITTTQDISSTNWVSSQPARFAMEMQKCDWNYKGFYDWNERLNLKTRLCR